MKKHKYVHQDVLGSIFFILLAISFLAQGGAVSFENKLMPTVAAWLVIVMSVVTMIQGVKQTKELNQRIENGEDVTPEISWKKLKGPVVTTAMIILYLIGVATLGFYFATLIFMPAYMAVQGYKKPIPISLITIGLTAGLYFVANLLDLVLPSGILF